MMDGHSSPGESNIGYEILTYLAEHPDSRDTLKGIAQWWLLARGVSYQMGQIKEALADLVSKEWILEYKSVSSEIRYGTNRNKYDEIRAFLKQRKGCDSSS